MALSLHPLHHPLPCADCTLSSIAHSVNIPTDRLLSSLPPSPSTPGLLLIGRNPGLEEDRLARHFVGKLSTVLHTVLIPGAHLNTLSTLYLTNVARCYHRDGAAPPRASFTACRPKLLTDIRALAPLHSLPFNILCMGAEATSHLCSLLGLKSLSLAKALSLQAKLLMLPAVKDDPGSRELPLRLFFTYHPAYLDRDHNVLPAMDDHLTLLRSALLGSLPSPSRPTFVEPFPPPVL